MARKVLPNRKYCLAGMFFARGMTTIVSSAPHTATNEAFLALKNFSIIVPGIGSYGKSGNFIPARIEPGVIIALVIVLAIWAILKWTRCGRNLYAVGDNSESALMLGVNVKRTRFFSYILCGLFAGIGGYVYLLHTGAGNAANASQAEIQAIASSIIGGTLLTGGVGSVIGTLFGVRARAWRSDKVRDARHECKHIKEIDHGFRIIKRLKTDDKVLISHSSLAPHAYFG